MQYLTLLYTNGEKNYMVHFLIAGVILFFYIIIKFLDNTNEIDIDSISSETDISKLEKIADEYYKKNPDISIAAYKRLLILNPNDTTSLAAIGILYFGKDNTLSGEYLFKYYNTELKMVTNLESSKYYDLVVLFYMLGYHFNIKNEISLSTKFKNAAFNTPSFKSSYSRLITEYPY
jgi:hypothetical protein